jgi:ribosomal protein L11 methyltransferase
LTWLRRGSAEIADRLLAQRVATALQDLIEPPPDALTIFEERASDGAPGHWRIEAYYPAARDIASLHADLEAVVGETLPPLAAAPIPDRNWVALSQAALPPVRAGRFTVHGSHDRTRVPRGPWAIEIDAGEAFGTAHHATTRGCLIAIDELTRRQSFRRVLDLGCGSGILSIAAARALPRARILAVDIDARSVEVAGENACANRLGRKLELVCASGVDDSHVRRNAPFDLVLANILAGPLISLAPKFRVIVRAGGTAVLSGLLKHEAPAVAAAMRAQGFVLLSHRRIGGWATLTFRKRSPLIPLSPVHAKHGFAMTREREA